METSRSHETSASICYQYQKFLNECKESYPKTIEYEKPMQAKSLPPSFHLIPAITGKNGEIVQKQAVKFNADTINIKEVKCLMTHTEYPNMFSNRVFPLVDSKNEYTKAEMTMFWSMQEWRVSSFYPHYIKFKLNDRLKIMAEFRQDDKTTEIAAGKLLRKLPWVLERTDADIEKMCNTLKSFLCPPITFKIVEGEDIRHWYHEDRYFYKSGTLINSCMRYSACQDYIEMYVKTDCKMLIATNSDNKLMGRAILWPRSMWNKNYFEHSDYIMDRIYGTETTIVRFKQYAIKNHFVYKKHQNFSDTQSFMVPMSKDKTANYEEVSKRMQMNWDQHGFNYWPYADTFNTLIDTHQGAKNFGEGEMLTETNGYTNEERCEFECYDCGNTCHVDDGNWVDDEQYCHDCTVYSDYCDESYRSSDAVYSECMQSYIHYDDSYTITHGNHVDDYVHSDEVRQVYLDDDSSAYTDDVCHDVAAMIKYLRDDDECRFQIYLKDLVPTREDQRLHFINDELSSLSIHDRNADLPGYCSPNNITYFPYHYIFKVEYDINEKPYVFLKTSTSELFDNDCWKVIMKAIQALDYCYNISSIGIKWKEEGEFAFADVDIIDIQENNVSVPTRSIDQVAIKFNDLYNKLGSLSEHFDLIINPETNAT